MKCFFCDASPSDGKTTLYRINPVGEKGIWACDEHAAQMNLQPPEEVAAVVRMIKAKRLS